MNNIERQEIWCHSCAKYVQFDIDISLNGNHVLYCPNCNHEHCRVVKDGIITDDRWDQRNGNTFYVVSSSITISDSSTYITYSGSTGTTDTASSAFLYSAWMDTTCIT